MKKIYFELEKAGRNSEFVEISKDFCNPSILANGKELILQVQEKKNLKNFATYGNFDRITPRLDFPQVLKPRIYPQ